MGKIVRFIVVSVLLFASLHAEENERGIRLVSKSNEISRPLYRKSFALIVGASQYQNGWPVLPQAVQDAKDVAATLVDHGFQIRLLLNPSHDKLEDALNDFVYRLGKNPEDRLLFYFAGHGQTLEMSYGSPAGFIVPVDAPLPVNDEAAFRRKAISMQAFEDNAKQIQAKHVLYIFDSCFSGTIFSVCRGVPASISYKTGQPVRQFITAGEAGETVSDKSIFKDQFIKGIEGNSDANRDGFITGTELGEYLQTTVVNYSKETQHPQFGKIRDPNLDAGDFVFVVPEEAASEKSRDFIPEMRKQLWEVSVINQDDAVPPGRKIDQWESFLLVYADDHPGSQLDDRMREYAFGELRKLKETRNIPKPIETGSKQRAIVRSPIESDGNRWLFCTGVNYGQQSGNVYIETQAGVRILRYLGASFKYGRTGPKNNLPNMPKHSYFMGGLLVFLHPGMIANVQGGQIKYPIPGEPSSIKQIEQMQTYRFTAALMVQVYKGFWLAPTAGWQAGRQAIENLEAPKMAELDFGIGFGLMF